MTYRISFDFGGVITRHRIQTVHTTPETDERKGVMKNVNGGTDY